MYATNEVRKKECENKHIEWALGNGHYTDL